MKKKMEEVEKKKRNGRDRSVFHQMLLFSNCFLSVPFVHRDRQ